MIVFIKNKIVSSATTTIFLANDVIGISYASRYSRSCCKVIFFQCVPSDVGIGKVLEFDVEKTLLPGQKIQPVSVFWGIDAPAEQQPVVWCVARFDT
jgi:hypothetical protein